jgi:hypothetical protein
MTLRVSAQVVWSDILDAPFVHVTGRQFASRDQVANPLRRVRVDFVVIVHSVTTSTTRAFQLARISTAHLGHENDCQESIVVGGLNSWPQTHATRQTFVLPSLDSPE